MAGPVAYAQEFVDAFRWWLAEKAEWQLENKAQGGPVGADAWTATLWKDSRIQAAWRVAAEAMAQVETWKQEAKAAAEGADKIANRRSQIANPPEAFARFLKRNRQR